MVGMITQWLPPAEAYGPVTCDACGCRLDADQGSSDGTWRHFSTGVAGQDARGCRPFCVDAVHDRSGRVLEAVV